MMGRFGSVALENPGGCRFQHGICQGKVAVTLKHCRIRSALMSWGRRCAVIRHTKEM